MTEPVPAMTIETILSELAAQHGNDWPNAAISHLIVLAARLSIMAEDEPNYPGELTRYRYQLLRAWLHDTLLAGIAARQTAAL